MAGVELSQGYVSFSVSTDGAQRQVSSFFDQLQGLADNSGKRVGASLQRGVGDGTKAALSQAKADHERYSSDVAVSMKKASAATDGHEAALRKVGIAEARLKELQDSGKASQSQILAATDRLASARKQVSETALKQAAADKSVKDAQDALRSSSEKLDKAQKDVDKSADKAGNSAQSMADKIKSGLRGLAAKVPNPFKPIEKDATDSGDKAGRNFNQEFKERTRGLTDHAKTALAGFTGALSALGVAKLGEFATAGVKLGIETAASMEQADIGFTTMLGSAEKAKTFIAGLADFAAKTPFDFPGLQKSASTLISAGIDANKVIPIMKTLGDVTSGMGTGAEGVQRATVAIQQMNAAGKIQGQDLNQLRDAGIPVYDLLSAALGKTKEEVADLANKGELGKDALNAMMGALESGAGLEKFSGLMDKQSASFNGMMSTFQDTLQMGLAETLQPLIPLLKDGLGVTAEFLANTALPAVRDGFQWLIDTGSELFYVLQDVFMMVDDEDWDPGAMGPFIGGLIEIGRGVQSVSSKFTEYSRVVASSVLPVAQRLADSFMKNIVPGLMSIASAIGTHVVPFVTRMADLFVQYVLPALALAGNFIADEVLPILGMMATFIGENVIPVAVTIGTIIMNTVVPALAGIYTAIMVNVLPPLMSFVRFIMENVMPKVMQLVNEVIVPAFRLIASIVTWAVNNIVIPLLGELGGFLKNVLGPAFKWLWEKIISPTIDLILAGVRWLRDDGVSTFQTFMDRARDTVQSGVNIISRVWDGIKSAFAGPMKVVEGIINGLIDSFNAVSKIFGGPTVARVTLVTSTVSSVSGSAQKSAYATGGVLPGYSPGKDDMHFFSPQWGSLSLSGGEAIMVPEFARLLGERGIEMLNQAARAGRRSLAGALGGMHFAGGGIVNLRGHTFTAEFARRLQLAEALARTVFSITQGGFRPATSYSGTSHAGDAVDIASPITNGVLVALRGVGIPAWDRTGKGNWMPHIHGVPLPGAGSAGGSAVWQAQDYLAGGDGLGGRDNGPRVGLLGNLGGVVLNLAAGARSLIDWGATFAKDMARVSEIGGPGAFGQVLRAVPGKVVEVISDGAGKLLGLPGFASGTESAPPGWAWVGESGPELIQFRGGERVLSNRDSRSAWDTDAIEQAVARGMNGASVTLKKVNLLTDEALALINTKKSRGV